MINEKKKFYAEQKAKAKRSKPMTQAQQREYMSTFIKNQSSWKLSQLKKLSFEELKTEFEKLMKSIESFVPMETEARVKRHGLQLEQETSKKQKIDIEDASITKGKDEVVKEEEAEVPVKKTGMRRKQKARKGINIAKTAQDEFNNEREAFMKDKVKDASSESEIGVDAIQTATKPPTIVNWKIISQLSQKAAYQIIRRDGSDKIYMSFGAILKDFSRDDLIELYRLVIKKYGANSPEEMYDRNGAIYMMNRQHGRIILESVENGPLIWPSIEKNRVTRPKKYSELSATEAIQADCDIKAINIILQGLPPEVYALVSNHRVAKELWARIQLLKQGTSLTKQERECKLYDEFNKFAYKKGATLRDFYLRFSLLLNDMNI
ncbi:hypothetical protein Tco_0408781 [Tanacetum coccineum]